MYPQSWLKPRKRIFVIHCLSIQSQIGRERILLRLFVRAGDALKMKYVAIDYLAERYKNNVFVVCYRLRLIRLDILYYQTIVFELTVCGKKRQRGRRGDWQMNGRISQRWIDRGQQLHGRARLKIMSLLRISKVEAEKIFKIGNIITISISFVR